MRSNHRHRHRFPIPMTRLDHLASTRWSCKRTTAQGFVTSTRFEIVAGQLRLKAGQQLDHEVEDQVTVPYIATDGGSLSRTENFVIAVTDLNEPPTAINLGNASVNENATAAVVGNVIVTDPDADAEPFGTHTFQVQEEDYGAGFVTSTRLRDC